MKKILKLKLLVAFYIVTCALTGCTEDPLIEASHSKYNKQLVVNVAQSKTKTNATEDDISRLDIILFKDNVLEKIISNITNFNNTNGNISVEVGVDTEGTRDIYTIANINHDEWIKQLVIGTSTVEDLKKLETKALDKMINRPLIMHGTSENINFNDTPEDIQCKLYHTPARIDVKNISNNFTLISAKLINARASSTIFPSTKISTGTLKHFEEIPTTNNTITLYTYENPIVDLEQATTVEITGEADGIPLSYIIDLTTEGKPIAIERNTLYVININNVKESSIETSITVNPWLVGNGIDHNISAGEMELNIVMDASVGTINMVDSTLNIKLSGGNLTITANSNAECDIQTSDDWIQVMPTTRSKSYITSPFSVQLEPNLTEVQRQGTITLFNKLNPETRYNLKIIQEADPYSGKTKYLVIAVAGQSNAVGYDESTVYPTGIHAPIENAFQLSYRTNGKNLEVVPLTWSADDVEDKTRFTNVSGLKGIKGIHLPLAKELNALIPAGYKLLFVNVAYSGAAFIVPRGQSTAYNSNTLSPVDMSQTLMWGVNKPYHRTLVDRIKYSLDLNPANKLIGVVWCQGEADALYSDAHYAAFTQMTQAIFDELNTQGYGVRCPKGTADKDMWYTFSTTRFFVDWYDIQNAAPVFGGYKTWNPNTFIHIPKTTADNTTGGNGVTGAGKYHFGNDTFRTVIAPEVAKCIDDNGGLFNGKKAIGGRFTNNITLSYANQYGGKTTDADVQNNLALYIPFNTSVSDKMNGASTFIRTGIDFGPVDGLTDINGNSRTRNAITFQKSRSKMTISNTASSSSYSIAFMLRRTESMGDNLQTIVTNAGAINAPFLGFRTYASGQRTANMTEFVFEPIYTGQKAKAVPGMLLEADNVASLDEWIHYVVTFDYSSKLCIVYMNGQEVQRATIATATTPSLSKLLFGYNSSSFPGFDGEMMELFIWNRVIAPSTVNKVFLHSYYGFNK